MEPKYWLAHIYVGKTDLVMWEKAHGPRSERHGFRSGDCLFSGLLQLGRGRA